MEGVTRFSVSVSPDLLKSFDRATREMGYDRSKAIGLAMRNFLSEHTWDDEKSGASAGAITLVYDHERRNVDKELTEIQHHHRDVIISTTHVHLDRQNCLLIIAVRGDGGMIGSLVSEVTRAKGVLQVRMASLTP
jgi:CopG family nickel-responsive transcriptional regulator